MISNLVKNSPSRRNARRRLRAFELAMAEAIEPLEPRTLLSVDLTGSITSVPVMVHGGTTQSITFTLTNEGGDSFRGSAPVDFYAVPVGSAFNPDTSTFLGAVSRGGVLRAGGTRSFTVRIPFGPQLTTGAYQVVGVINPNHTVAESNVNNNIVQSNTISVTEPSFDLAVAFARGPNLPLNTTVGAARNGAVPVIVTNPSTSTAAIPPRQSVDVQIVAEPFGENAATGGAILNRGAARINVGGLAPGRSRTIDVPVQLPADLPVGLMNLVARVNTQGAIAESNTLNNQAVLSTPLVITPAPVVVSNPGRVAIGTTPGTGAIGRGGAVTATPGAVGAGGSIGVIGLGTGAAAGASVGVITSSIGLTPINSIGVTPLNATGVTPINALGLTPTTSFGVTPTSFGVTPTSFGTTLSSSVLSLFIV